VKTKKPDYMDVVSLQAFSGSWKINTELAAVVGKSIAALQGSAPIKVLNNNSVLDFERNRN